MLRRMFFINASNRLSYNDGEVKKTYHYPLRTRFRQVAGNFLRQTTLWQSNRMRFEREVRTLTQLAERHVHTPTLVRVDADEPSIVMNNLSATGQRTQDLRSILGDQSVGDSLKIRLLADAFRSLSKLHAEQIYHGDSLAKNFFIDTPVPSEDSTVCTCDFEISRNGSWEKRKAADVMDLAADATRVLYATGMNREFAFNSVVYALETGYGTVNRTTGVFSLRDKVLYRLIFGMTKDFFEYFADGNASQLRRH